MGVNDIQIVPVNVYWQQVHTDSFNFKGKDADALAGKYVELYPANSGEGYYAYFSTTTSADPAPAGLIKITVAILDTDTAAQIATKFATAVTAVTGSKFKATAAQTVASVKRGEVGETKVSADGANDDASGVVVQITKRGRDFDLGLLQGDVALSFEPSNFEVTAHQTGVTPRAAIFQGLSTLECTTTLQETGTAQLEVVYNLYGGTFQTEAGNKIYGVGSLAQGKNLLTEAGRLVLRPVNAVDQSQDVTIMAAIPVPGGLTFSGENPRVLEITWRGFIDEAFNPAANAIAIGDLTGA